MDSTFAKVNQQALLLATRRKELTALLEERHAELDSIRQDRQVLSERRATLADQLALRRAQLQDIQDIMAEIEPTLSKITESIEVLLRYAE